LVTLVAAGATEPVMPVTAGATDPVTPPTVPVAVGATEPVTAGRTDLVVPVTAGGVLPAEPVTAGRVVPVIPLTALVTVGRADPVAAGGAVWVTAPVAVGWVCAVRLVTVPVSPDSVLAGFGPEAAGVAAGCVEVVWGWPVTLDAALVAADCAPPVTWLTALVTLATGEAGAAAGWLVLAGWLLAGFPAGCAVAGWAAAGCLCDAAPWLLPRLWVVPLTPLVTLLTAAVTPLVLLAAGGWAGALAGFGWLAGGAALGWAGAGGELGGVWAEPGWDALLGAAGWVRLCTAPLAAPVSEPSAEPAPFDAGEPGSVAAEARPARRNAKISAAAIPPQTHRQTLRARPKARSRVADPSTGRRLHRVPIIIHTYSPVLSGQNRQRSAPCPDKHDQMRYQNTRKVTK
jgi:hypothetical protein